MKKTYSVNLEQYNGVMNNNSYNSVVSQSTDMRKFLLPAKVLAIVLIFLFSASFVQAATYTSVASGNWNADATWSGTGTPVAGDIVNIVGGFNVTLTADAACASITFTTTTATSLTLGTYKLDVSGAITIPRSGSGFNQIIVGAGTLNAGSIAFTSGGGTNRHQITISTGTVTVTGDITTDNSGASATIIFTGAGTLNAGVGIMTTTTSGGTLTTISGSTVNYNGVTQTVKPVTYAGNLTLSGNGAKTLTGATINGTLSIQGTATATGTSPTYGASAILEYKGSSAQTTSNVEFPASTAVDVTINNASGATLNAAKTTTGMLTMTNGTLDVLNYNLTVGSLTGSSNINKSSSTTATNTLTFGSDNTSTTYSGVISNTAGTVAVTKNGTGTLTLSGSNSYSGATTITAGILQLGSAGSGANSPLGTIAGATSVTSGAALDLNGFTLATTEPLTLNGTGISNSGALTNSSATDVGYSGLITLGSASSIVTNTAGDINITNTGTITGATFGLTLGGSGNGSIASIIGTTSGTITKSGSGSWTVSGANTYTGLTTISAGTLKLGAAGGATYTPLGTTGTGTTVTSGAALDLNGFTLGTTEALTLNGTGISSGGALMNSGTAATYSGLIALGSASSIIGGTGTIAVSNAGTITGATFGITLGGAQGGTLSSILGTTSGTLTKIDAGTWTLGGLNTYTGLTTINGGVIKFGAHGGASSGPLGNIGASSGTIVANGAALDLAGYNENANELLTLNGTGIGGGALRNSGGADTYAGLITLASASSIVGDGGTISVSNSGTITGATFGLTLGGAQGGTLASILGTTSGTLTKEGAGIWTLSGASTYTGLTTIDAGILKLGAAGGGTNSPLGTIGSGTSVTSGAVLDLNGFSLGIAEALTLNGTGISSGGALTNSSATAVNYTGAITLGSTTSINTTGNITLGSNGISGGQDLIKVGSAILSLGSGTADLGSLTISAGTLTSTSGTMSMSGDFTNNSAFTHNSGTVNFDGTTQAIGGSYSATFNNLALAGSGTKTFGKQTTISGNLSISSGVVANLGTGFTHPTGTLTLGGSGQPNGTWGSTSSTATYKNDTYFAATTGMLNVSTASCTGGIWLGLISNDWNTDANWCGGKPTNTTDVIIPSGLTNYPVLGAPGSCRTINDMAGGSISGTGTLTITGNAGVAITNISGTGVTISCPVALPASASISVNGSLEISGAISGAGTTLTKAGTGVLTLSGNNTYTGATAITAGTLELGATGTSPNGPLGTTGGATSVTSGAVLDLNGYTLATAEPLTLNGTGISSGGALMNSGTAATYGGLITLGSTGVSIEGGTGMIALSNTGTITGSGFSLTLGGAAGGSVASIIGTGTGTLTKADAGTWTLSGASTYTGLTTISAGILKLGAAGGGTNTPLGTTGSGTSVATGAALDLNGFTLGTAEALTLNGTGISSGGALTNSGGACTYSGVITFNTAASIVGEGGTISITGTPVSGTTIITFGGSTGGSISTVIAGARTITKEGTGTWTLSGNNSYSSGTTINAGTISITNINATGNQNLGSGGITFANGGTLLNTGSGGQSTAKAITLNSGGGVISMSGPTITLTGTISGGGGLTSGGSDLILNRASGTNTIGAITVTSGRLFVFTTGSIGTSSIAVQNGATVDFGITGGATLTNTMTFASGACLANRVGTLTVSTANTTFPTAGTMIFNSDDQVTSAITVNGAYPTLTGDLTMQLGGSNATVGTVTLNGVISGGYSLDKTSTGTLSFGSQALTLNNLTISAGALTATSGTMNLAGNFSNNGTFTHNSGTVTFNGTGAQTIGGTSTTFSTVVINKSSGTASLTASESVAGNLTVTAGTLDLSTYTMNRSTSGGTLTVSNGATLKIGGTNTLPSNYSAHSIGNTSTIEYSGTNQSVAALNSSQIYGNLVLSGSGTKTFTTARTISGNLSISGTAKALLTNSTSSSAGTLTLGGVYQASGSWGSSGSPATYKNDIWFVAPNTGIINVTTSGCTGGTWLGTTSTDWNDASNWCGGVPSSTTDVTIPSGGKQPEIGAAGGVCRNLTISSGASLTINGSYTLSVYGDWTNNGGTFTPGTTGTVSFNGTGGQEINGTATSQTFNNFIVHKSSGSKLTVGGSTTSLTVNDFTETSGDFTAPLAIDINGNLTLTAGTFTTGNTISLAGNWTKSSAAVFEEKTGVVTFDGTGDQAINGTATSQTFYDLVVNKSSNTLSIGGSTSSLTVRDFTLTAGTFSAPATIDINGNLILTAGTFTAGTTTTLAGNWMNNGVTFTYGSGTVTFDGATQTIGGSAVLAAFNNLTISSSTSTTLNVNTSLAASLSITGGQFIVSAGKYLDVKSGSTTLGSAQCLVLESDATGAASFIDNGTISGSGTAKIERYITPYNTASVPEDWKFHFLSSPVGNAQAIMPEFQTMTNTTDDFFMWKETTSEWVNSKLGTSPPFTWNTAFGAGNGAFVAGQGYLVAYPSAVTKYFIGKPYTSSAGLTVTCTNTNAPGTDVAPGWNLLGNPFPSPIDWNAVDKGSGMDNALYYYDNSVPRYRYYIALTGGVGTAYSGGSRYIPAMQGFMVHAKTSGTKTITMANSDRVHQSLDLYYKDAVLSDNVLNIWVEGNNQRDDARICFYDLATENFDGEYDAYKLFSYNTTIPELYSVTSDSTQLAINTLPLSQMYITVPVGFLPGTAGIFTFNAEGVERFPSSTYIFLEDLKTGTMQKLNDNPAYTFTSYPADAASRFLLHFQDANSITNPDVAKNFTAYSKDGIIHVIQTQNINGSVMVTDMAGRIVATTNLIAGSPAQINMQGHQGVYIVSIITPMGVSNAKIIVN